LVKHNEQDLRVDIVMTIRSPDLIVNTTLHLLDTTMRI